MKYLVIACSLCIVYCLDIEDFGAKSEDASLKTALLNGAALNAALLAANSGPDKTVIIQSEKTYTMLPAGDVNNLEDITIQLDGKINAWGGAEEEWPLDSTGKAMTLISINYSTNLTIKGSGIIDGQGYRWWWKTILTGKDNRPILLQIGHSKNLIIDQITMKNGPRFHIFLDDVFNVLVQNIIVHVDITDDKDVLRWIPTFPLNTDGIDVSGKDILFRNLTIQNFDDAVAVKPTRNNNAIYSECTENLLIEIAMSNMDLE